MKQRTGKKLLTFLLTLAMVVGLMPGMSLTAYAAPTEELLTTITAVGASNAPTATSANVSYSTEDIATLTFSQVTPDGYGGVSYTPTWGWWGYYITITVAPVDGYTITKCVFYDNANHTATDSSSPFVVETTGEKDKTPRVNGSIISDSNCKGIKKIEVYGYATPTHTHSFTYSASGATLTATCTADGCTLPPSTDGGSDHVASLTIAAPPHVTYGDGNDASATVTDANSIQGDAKVQYQKKTGDSYGTATETAPTDAGTYKASITLGEATASVEYTIAKADPGTPTVTMEGYKFGGDVPTPSITSNPGSATVTYYYSTTDSASGGTAWEDVGAKTLDANGYYMYAEIAESDNYNAYTTATTSFTVTKAGAQTIADVTDTLAYTATSVSKSVAGLMPDDAGDLNYHLGEVTTTGSVSVSGQAVSAEGVVTATLSGGSAGDTVTLPVTINSTNYDNSAVNVVITLTEKGDAGAAIEGVPAGALTYGDADFTLTGSVTDAGDGTGTWTWGTSDSDVFQITPDGATATVKVLKAGSATVTAKYESDTTVDTETTAAVTVNKKGLTVTAASWDIFVGGTVPDLSEPVQGTHYSVTGLLGEDALTTAPTLAYSPENPDNTKAGTYDVVPSGAAAGDNYAISYESGKLTISDKGTQTITTDDVTATYGDEGVSVSAETDGDGKIGYAVKEGADVIDVDAESGALTIKKVGTATVAVTAAETATYVQANKDVAVTVNKADSKVAKAPATTNPTYSGKAQELVTAGTAEGGTMAYSLDGKEYSEAIPTGTDAKSYTVWYKVFGDANHNDSEAKSVTSTIAKKDEPQPGPTPAGDVVSALSGHVQNVGDVAGEPSGRGARVGTEGRSLRLESFSLSLPKDVEGSVEYRAHVQNVGWDAWVADGAPCGTAHRSLRLEAVQVRLAGKLAYTHSVWYRVHAQNVGTMGWARDGQAAGTAGQSLRLESIEVQVLPRGEAPSDYAEGQASYVGAVSGSVHVQNQGWAGSGSGLEFGTTGQSRRLEAVRLGIGSQPVSGGIEYEVHAQNRGWMPAAADGALAGTTGQSRRLEAVRVRLTGEAAKEGNLSVWYRVHSQNQGWLGWACDGQKAGTEGLSLRAEAIDVQVLPQGQVPRGYDASRPAYVTR